MNFLDLGLPELVLILIIVLIAFGPRRVVEIGRTLGKTVRAFRKATSNLTAEITREIKEEPSPEQGEKKADKTDKLAKS